MYKLPTEKSLLVMAICLVFFGALVHVGTLTVQAAVCPFCSAVNRTFGEQIDTSDIVVIARLIEAPKSFDEATLPRGLFVTTDVLKGGRDLIDEELSTIIVGKHTVGDHFLLMGTGDIEISWSSPLKTSARAIEYLKHLQTLPESGAERLSFFAGHFEDEDSTLAYDAYDEFARAPYEDVKGAVKSYDRQQLITWIKDPDVMKARKRLYYTLLGICGTEKEIPLLEELIKSGDRDKQAGLDALIACYLVLKGDDGVPLIEELFLGNENSEYIDTFSAIQALRFMGTESDRVSVERIVAALRHVLDRPKMADMVIPDLARWEDWSVMERLVQMFKDANTDETNWVRTPIIAYLQVCPRPEAKGHVEALREIDPDAVRRAEMLADLNWDEEDDIDDSSDTTEKKTVDGGDDDGKAGKTGGGGSGQGDKKKDPPGDGGEGSGAPADIVNASFAVAAPAPNSSGGVYVSTSSTAVPGSTTAERVAQNPALQPTAPVAATEMGAGPRVAMVLALLFVSAVLFLLLWSVLNGWFERLVF